MTFQIWFQYILARRAKMYWNLIWKVPDLSHLQPIWPTLGLNLAPLLNSIWLKSIFRLYLPWIYLMDILAGNASPPEAPSCQFGVWPPAWGSRLRSEWPANLSMNKFPIRAVSATLPFSPYFRRLPNLLEPTMNSGRIFKAILSPRCLKPGFSFYVSLFFFLLFRYRIYLVRWLFELSSHDDFRHIFDMFRFN